MAALFAAGNVLEQRRAEINTLNVFPVPDGDTGTNMLLTWQVACEAANAALMQGEQRVGPLVHSAAEAALLHARGSSGLILSQLLHGAATALADRDRLRAPDLVLAFRSAVETARAALMHPVEGTILSVMTAAAVEWTIPCRGPRWAPLLAAITDAATAALVRTPSQLDVLARAGCVDAGGSGLVALLDGMAAYAGVRSSRGPGLTQPLPVVSPGSGTPGIHEAGEPFGYCTQFLIVASGREPQSLRAEAALLGESAQVVGNAHVVRVHVHTADPGAALSWGARLGRLSGVRVEDMQAQHDERSPMLPEHRHGSVPQYGTLSASSGAEGMASSPKLSTLVLHRAEHPTPVEGLQVAALVAGAGFAQACAELGADALWRDDASDTVEHGPTGGDPCPRRVEEAMTLVLTCHDARITLREAAHWLAVAGMEAHDQPDPPELDGVHSIVVPTSAHAITALLALRQGQSFREAIAAIAASVAAARWCDLAAIWRQTPSCVAHRAEHMLPLAGLPADTPQWLRDGVAYAITSLQQAGAPTSELITLFRGDDTIPQDAWPSDHVWSQGDLATNLLTAALRAAFPHTEIAIMEGGQQSGGYLALLE